MLDTFIATLREKLDIRQAIKTALAALISAYISLQLNYYIPRPDIFISGLWSVVASIVVLQPLIGGTYKAVTNRFIGVILGSIVGAFFVQTIGGSYFILGLAIFSTIVLCSFLSLQEAYRIAGLSVAVVIIPSMIHPELSPWAFALFRFLDTCIGMFVALLVAKTVWPTEATSKVRSNISMLVSLLNHLFKSVFIVADETDQKRDRNVEDLCNEIEDILFRTKVASEEAKLEKFINSHPTNIWAEIIDSIEGMFNEIRAITRVFSRQVIEVLDQELRNRVSIAEEKIEDNFKVLSAYICDTNVSPDMNGIPELIAGLNDELARFRETRATRIYNFEFVEKYFVFFFSLKAILHEQQHLSELIRSTHEESEGS